MSDSEIEAGGPLPPEPNTYNPIFFSSMAPGTPVAIMTAAEAPRTGIVPNSVLPAQASTVNKTYAIGLVIRNASPGDRGVIRYLGPVTLPAGGWADVLDTGTELTQGVPYYLSSAVAGKITLTPPDVGGTFVQPIGYALSPSSMFVDCTFPTAG
jgi:hypothetical protein